MTFKVVPRYENDLWYPILVKIPNSSNHMIVEMRGKEVNEWNDMVRRQWREDTKRDWRKGWYV